MMLPILGAHLILSSKSDSCISPTQNMHFCYPTKGSDALSTYTRLSGGQRVSTYTPL